MIDDHGLSPEARARWARRQARPADARHARAPGGWRACFVPDEQSLLEQFPELAGQPYPRAGSYAAVPLLAYGSPQGVLSVGFGRRVAFDADQRALLNALAGQAAIAIARAQLYEREHTVSQTLQAVAAAARAAGRARARPGGAAGVRGARASRSAATSTTRSRSATARGGSRSATSAARASTPPR